MAYATTRDSRLPGALAAIAAQALLVIAVVWGLAARYFDEPEVDPETRLVVLPAGSEPAASPPAPTADEPEGEGAPAALEAEARLREAPAPKLTVADPRPAASEAGSGEAGRPGLATNDGVGTGRGGAGEGTGQGAAGSGRGSGVVTPPQRISGTLGDRDYPRSAAARGAAGTVAISFGVGADGRVSRCSVIGSSGDAELDRLTCALVERRFVYRPARNAAGQAVETTLRTTFTWGTYR